ncbi:carbon storage regulator CsrA [Spongisporangium articulatum]|uniref:Translational regulator CsrA n=1 Tax=Spongisporangium articulatum TaxID=3362603 RepID=A0ABW8AHL1_9ACTN
MLVLTRRAGESIVIGDDVRVVVLDVRGDTVRLGIEAPRSIQVHRAEVYAEVQAANAAAASPADAEELAERLRRFARPVGGRRIPRPSKPAGERGAGSGEKGAPPSGEPAAEAVPQPAGAPKPSPEGGVPPKPRPPGRITPADVPPRRPAP